VQICRSRLLAVSVLGERNGDDGRSMRRLTQWRLNSPLPGRARRGRRMGCGCLLRRPALIPTAGSERCCCPPSSAEQFVSLRAEMLPPSPELRSRTRRMVRPVLGSADHARSPAGSAFGAFASAEAPNPSIPSLATLTRSPKQRRGPRHIRSTHIYIDCRCSSAIQSPPDSVLQFRRRCGPRRRPRSRCGVVGDGVR
jgi:hypothetical protein